MEGTRPLPPHSWSKLSLLGRGEQDENSQFDNDIGLPHNRSMPLISFEGAEGSGKSTQVNLLDSRLKQAGIRTHVFREPGGTRIGEAIRDLVQHSEENEGIAAETELLLFAASRS